MAVGKACLYSHVFRLVLKALSEGARRISAGKLFQRQGATAEKARFLVFSHWASLGVRPLSCLAGLERVIRVEQKKALCQVSRA